MARDAKATMRPFLIAQPWAYVQGWSFQPTTLAPTIATSADSIKSSHHRRVVQWWLRSSLCKPSTEQPGGSGMGRSRG